MKTSGLSAARWKREAFWHLDAPGGAAPPAPPRPARARAPRLPSAPRTAPAVCPAPGGPPRPAPAAPARCGAARRGALPRQGQRHGPWGTRRGRQPMQPPLLPGGLANVETKPNRALHRSPAPRPL